MIGLFDFPYAPTSEETVRWLEVLSLAQKIMLPRLTMSETEAMNVDEG